jgi:hypothetical protein
MSASLPEHIVARLFARMLSLWGTRFTALWADSDEAEVKAVWAKALAYTKPEDFKRGLAALFHEPKPPDLPRFLELCRPVPQQFVTNAMLRDERTWAITPEGAAQLQAIKALLAEKPVVRAMPAEPQAEPVELPPRVPSPHIYGDREPGEDDEQVSA